MNKYLKVFWENADRIFIGLAIVLIPVFFIPITSNYLELNKQVMLLVLLFIGSIFVVVKIFPFGDMKLNLSALDVAITAFVVIYGLSTAFSLSRMNSFWGWSSSVSASFLTLLLLWVKRSGLKRVISSVLGLRSGCLIF